MYVCMYVYTHIYIYIFIYVRIHDTHTQVSQEYPECKVVVVVSRDSRAHTQLLSLLDALDANSRVRVVIEVHEKKKQKIK
jgi:hypothetical protein